MRVGQAWGGAPWWDSHIPLGSPNPDLNPRAQTNPKPAEQTFPYNY